ncbi:MAG: ribonuclease T [Oceanospirillaceae bacterium]|nr:ribonuclease T [Oceanospirillaceae bacterium]HCI02942.1 ribonuclease T [Oceanospirillaceae bacterium]|tara:strand:- start:636 stop:1265 length:630 start_codon:yes stop_codon:yes gene_type:complete
MISERFRGYLPVIVDVETAGFNHNTDALLEVAAVMIDMDSDGLLYSRDSVQVNVAPFEGANLEAAALEFTGIDPFAPERMAVSEREALDKVFKPIRRAVKASGCKRAILVGHNAAFDIGFVNAAVHRTQHKRNPFHPFSTFDTATLAGLAFGQTVLAKACQAAAIAFDNREAHSALYDAEKTAELFCYIVNRWRELGGWQAEEDFPFGI